MLTGWRLTVSKLFLISQRWVVGLMSFNVILVHYILRVVISITITEMVVPRVSNSTKESPDACPVTYTDDEDSNKKTPHTVKDPDKLFKWSEADQGYILGAFFIGYLITHLPGGVLAEKFGAKMVLNLCTLLCAILSFATPIALNSTNGNMMIFIAIRVVQGLTQGPLYPAVNYLLATWVPLKERGLIGTVAFAGAIIGTVFCNAVAGALVHATEDWAVPYYVFAAISIVFCVLWQLLIYSTPNQHPFITDEELEYLKEELGSTVQSKKPPIPWKKILSNGPVLALVSAQFGHDWGYFTVVTDINKYFKDVLKMRVKDNALWSASTFFLMFVSSIISGWIADWLVKRNLMTISNVRKLGATISSFGPSAFILLASYSGCNVYIAGTMFILSMASMGPFYPGLKVNAMDLTPNYSGTLMAIVNGFGSIAGFLSPIVIGKLTTHNELKEWRLAFWIVFIIFNVTNATFVIWGSADIQPFNNPVSETAEE